MSGAVLGGVSVAYYLLEHSRYSLVSISANLLLLLVSATFLWANIASFANKCAHSPAETVSWAGLGL